MRTNNLKIYAYHTHYVIEGYRPGLCYDLERLLSTFDDKITFSATEYFYYDGHGNLYIPRGIDPEYLHQVTGRPIEKYVKECNPYKKMSFAMKMSPRDDIQKESIRFLLGRDDYKYTSGASQLVLSLIGGGGKTYCAVTAMSIFEMKTIVICHSDLIKQQWRDRILQYSYLAEDQILMLDSSKQLSSYLNPTKTTQRIIDRSSVFLITHSLMHSFMKNHFDDVNQLFINLGIGLKIVDEFHRNFMNTLLIDYATDVYKTFYLSATPGRTDNKENLIFQNSFNRVYKLKRTAEDMNREKKIIAIYDLFRSNLSQIEIQSMYNRKTFSVHKYTEYELEDGKIIERLDEWLNWLDGKVSKGQMIFVLSSMKSSCDDLAKIISKWYPDKKVCSYHSGNKIDNYYEYDIVCATVSMVGTGNDYQNLKAVINMEAFGSAVTADQLVHRLDRGNTDIGYTYYIDLIDKKVPNARAMYKKRSATINQFVLKSLIKDSSVIRR